MRQVGFAYAHIRLQARLAGQPSALDWQMIDTGRDFAQTLEAVKHGTLARFVSRLGRESTAADVEDALRKSWAELVAEIADWVPGKWREALMWLVPLPHLSLVEARLASDLDGAEEIEATVLPGTDITRAWRSGLQGRLPGPEPALEAALAPLLERFLKGPPRPATGTAELARHLEKLFRDRASEPVAVFAWLGLMALTLERLRGTLVLARLFPGQVEEVVP